MLVCPNCGLRMLGCDREGLADLYCYSCGRRYNESGGLLKAAAPADRPAESARP